MAEIRVIDAGENLLITGRDESHVAATLRNLVLRGATAIGQPRLVGTNWSASCTKPDSYYAEPTALDIGEAPQPDPDAFSNVNISEMGQKVLVSGKSKAAVQEALNALKTMGARNISDITPLGASWIATCEDPPSEIDECTIDVFGMHRMVTGATREAVETKVKEITEHVGTVLKIENSPNGGWIALIDDSGPTKW